MAKVKLTKQLGKLGLRLCCLLPILRFKLLYLLQVNNLFICTTENQENTKDIKLSATLLYSLKKNVWGDIILSIVVKKTSSLLIDEKLTTLKSPLQSLFNANVLSSKNTLNAVEYKILYKQTEPDIYLLTKPTPNAISKGYIKIGRYHTWTYRQTSDKEAPPHASGMLLAGTTGSGKSRACLMIIDSLVRDHCKVIVGDFKLDDLMNYGLAMGLETATSHDEILEKIDYLENLLKTNDRTPVILVIDELSSLLNSYDSKKSESIKKKLKHITLMGRSKNKGLILVQQKPDIDTTLRENLIVKLSMSTLNKYSHEMLFSEPLDNSLDMLYKEQGQGFIAINSKPEFIQMPKILYPYELESKT